MPYTLYARLIDDGHNISPASHLYCFVCCICLSWSMAPPFVVADLCRSYLKQAREEMGRRVLSKVYQADDGTASKFWIVFAKRKFMNKSL